MALLTGERAGRICTVSAGAVSVRATFSGPPGEPLPPRPVLPECPNASYHALRRRRSGEELTLTCEVRATRPEDLAASVDDLLRALSAHAALAGAIFEVRVLRIADPLVPDAAAVGELARHLLASGLGVSFGPSPVPAPDGAVVCLGASGDERRIERILREHPAWQPVYP